MLIKINSDFKEGECKLIISGDVISKIYTVVKSNLT